jgi:hypothetical protein
MALDRDAQAVQFIKEYLFDGPCLPIRKRHDFSDKVRSRQFELEKDVRCPFVDRYGPCRAGRGAHRCVARDNSVCSGGPSCLAIGGVASANAVTSNTRLEQIRLRKIRSITTNDQASRQFRPMHAQRKSIGGLLRNLFQQHPAAPEHDSRNPTDSPIGAKQCNVNIYRGDLSTEFVCLIARE